MAVIKYNGQTELTHEKKSVAFNFEDISAKANQYLATVRKEADEILANARKEAEEICSQAAQQGRHQAVAQAEDKAKKAASDQMKNQLKTLQPALQGVVQQLQNEKFNWFRKWQENAIHLAVEIAKRVIRKELTNDPGISYLLIKEALELAAGSQKIRVFLHPADYKALGDSVNELIVQLGIVVTAEIASDPTVTAGGCRIQTDFGEIDQQIESQLKRIEKELI
ncbi:MAG: hypothetical protein MPJ24_06775 [Pirellulaceae bacterium]|nr:hypothetical protein [Pirellulaceae bacterium]